MKKKWPHSYDKPMFSYTEDNRAVNMHKRMSEWKENLRKPLQKRIRTFDETIVRRIFRNYIVLCRTLMKRVRYLSCEFCRNKGETAWSYVAWRGKVEMFAFRFLVPIFAFDGSLTTFESADETRMEKGTCTLQYTPLLLRAIV